MFIKINLPHLSVQIKTGTHGVYERIQDRNVGSVWESAGYRHISDITRKRRWAHSTAHSTNHFFGICFFYSFFVDGGVYTALLNMGNCVENDFSSLNNILAITFSILQLLVNNNIIFPWIITN